MEQISGFHTKCAQQVNERAFQESRCPLHLHCSGRGLGDFPWPGHLAALSSSPPVWRGQTGESFSPACSVNLLSVTNVFGTPQHVQLQTTGANEHADWMGSELWRKQDMNRKGLIAMMEVATLRQKCKKKKWLQLPGTFIISICMLVKGEWKSFLQFLSHSFSKG